MVKILFPTPPPHKLFIAVIHVDHLAGCRLAVISNHPQSGEKVSALTIFAKSRQLKIFWYVSLMLGVDKTSLRLPTIHTKVCGVVCVVVGKQNLETTRRLCVDKLIYFTTH